MWFRERDQQGMEKVLTQYGIGFSDWVRQMKDRCLAERLPESQGGLNKDLPPEMCRMVADLMMMTAGVRRIEADRWYAQTANYQKRQEMRREAEEIEHWADFFLRCTEEIERRQHLLDSGLRKPRHRFRDGAATDEDDYAESVAAEG
ncbi:MAG: hypothetical protein ACYCU5_16295 [Actinomycetes bacterium]